MLNLTPHSITVRGPNGDHVFPPSGQLARVCTVETVTGTCPVTGVTIISRTMGAVTGLPTDGTTCIVSAMVLSALPVGTPGVFAPDSGPTAIRENGNVVAVTRLVMA